MRWQTTPSKAVSANEQFFALEINSRFRVGVSRRRRLRIFRGPPCAPFFRANGFGGDGATSETAFARGIKAHAGADAENLAYYRPRRFRVDNETRTNHPRCSRDF